MRLKSVIPRDPVTGEWEPRNDQERAQLDEYFARINKEPESQSGTEHWLGYGAGLLLALGLLALAFCTAAKAHDIHETQTHEPDWIPNSCCHGRDCYPVKYRGGEVKIVEGGYYIVPDHLTIPFSDPKVRRGNPTQDFYVCRNWKRMTNPVHCIFPGLCSKRKSGRNGPLTMPLSATLAIPPVETPALGYA